MHVVVYLGVCSLVGLNLVASKSKIIYQYGNEMESVSGWANSFGRFSDGTLDANETIADFLKHNVTQENYSNMTDKFGNGRHQAGYGNNGSVSGSGAEIRRHGNETGIPIEMFYHWWNAVRPFGNQMATRPIYPWIVAVQSVRGQSNSLRCSGNILTKLYVLSTCHCLSTPTGSTIVSLIPTEPSTIRVLSGMSMLDMPLKEQLLYGQIRNAADIHIHPHCSLTQTFNYAVIELEYYLYYTSRVHPMPDPFQMTGGKIHEGKGDRPSHMQENDICQAAMWASEQNLWNGEPKGEQKLSDFIILGKDNCSTAISHIGYQPVCTKAINGNPPWKSAYSQSGDIGSGLVCKNRVTAILSHHIGDYTVFASIRGALSFIWKYYQDQNEIYILNPSQVPAVSSILLIFTIHVPAIVTYV